MKYDNPEAIKDIHAWAWKVTPPYKPHERTIRAYFTAIKEMVRITESKIPLSQIEMIENFCVAHDLLQEKLRKR